VQGLSHIEISLLDSKTKRRVAVTFPPANYNHPRHTRPPHQAATFLHFGHAVPASDTGRSPDRYIVRLSGALQFRTL
jgi:hypothetical protein